MHDANNAMIRAARQVRRAERARRRVLVRHRDVVGGGMRVAVRALFVVLCLPAIVGADVLLAGGTIDFLMSLSGDLKEFGHPTLLKFIAITLIVLTEVKVAVAIAHALDERSRREVVVLAAVGVVIAATMTLMSFALSSAKADTDGLVGVAAHLPFGVAALTLALHSLALLSGDAIRDGVSWLSFVTQHGMVVVFIAITTRRAERSREAIGRSYRAYRRGIDGHNAEYPEARVGFGPIESDLEAVLRTLFSEDELQFDRSGPEAEPAPSPPEPSAPAPAPAPAPPPPAAPDTPPPANEDTVQSDFTTLLAEEEARRNESEVTP
jgi:hypothetical protein